MGMSMGQMKGLFKIEVGKGRRVRAVVESLPGTISDAIQMAWEMATRYDDLAHIYDTRDPQNHILVAEVGVRWNDKEEGAGRP